MFTFARGIFHSRFSVASSQGTRTAPFKFFEIALQILDSSLRIS
jgi:hypothetical protein